MLTLNPKINNQTNFSRGFVSYKPKNLPAKERNITLTEELLTLLSLNSQAERGVYKFKNAKENIYQFESAAGDKVLLKTKNDNNGKGLLHLENKKGDKKLDITSSYLDFDDPTQIKAFDNMAETFKNLTIINI